MTTVPALNIIQNLDPTDTIMITHADGSTERFSASKIIPADTVASGNMQSVTSNAVFNLNSISNITIQNRDVLTIAESCSGDRVTFFRGYECTNSPISPSSNDFYYQVSRLVDSKWIKIIASDLRSDDVYFISKINGVWGSWAKIQKLESFTENNVITSGTLNCGESFVSYKNGTMKLFARFVNYATPTVIQENDIIGVITQSYLRPNEVIKIPCYSFGNQHTYFIQIFPNGNITIGVAGTSSPVPYDLYINVVYVK